MTKIYETDQFTHAHGVIRLEQWTEGLVLWVGGQMVWKSWSDPELEVKLTVNTEGVVAAIEKLLKDVERPLARSADRPVG